MQFDLFLKTVHAQIPRNSGTFKGRLLALDPGETTGWSIWDSHDNASRYEMHSCGQLPTWDKEAQAGTMFPIIPAVQGFAKFIEGLDIDQVIMEVYRVYEWKADSHSWSDVPTLRIIGVIETILHQHNIPYWFQTAQVAKNFATDDRLKEWGFYQRGQRHSRDSMRHALYFLLFGPQGKQRN